MAGARAACQRLDALARRAEALGIDVAPTSGGTAFLTRASGAWSDGGWYVLPAGTPTPSLDAAAVEQFCAAMDDDLGTPQGVAVIFDTLRRANAALDRGDNDARILTATVIDLANALGLAVDIGRPAAGTDDAAIGDLVARRQAAREAKDWAAADSLRDELSALGVVVEDTPAGPVWRRA